MIQGYATLEGTRKYRESNGWTRRNDGENQIYDASPIALGNHMGTFSDEDSNAYKETACYALANGINVLDTAINYRGMLSEKDTGCVLQQMISSGQLKREEVVVVSKAGLLFGDITKGLRPQAYLEQYLVSMRIMSSDFHEYHGLLHTLNPEFYREALRISLENLGLETIDIHYIHMPEISRAKLGEEEFYLQMETLFEFYEKMVQEGKIRYYGIALETLCEEPEEKKWYLSLEKLKHLSDQAAAGESHFHFLQLPYNYKCPSASTIRNQIVNGRVVTLLEAAKLLGMEAIGSMPFAMGDGFAETSLTNMLSFCLDQKEISWINCGCKKISHMQEIMDVVKKQKVEK